MTQKYRRSLWRRLLNLLMRPLIRLGLGGRRMYLLTVRGRRTGRPYSTPVMLVEDDGGRWLVAPYGERNWVKNARAAGEVELARAGRAARFRVVEAGAAEAAPVLRAYVRSAPITRPFFDAAPKAPVEEFEREAHRHPVFRLEPLDEP
jgi:deazaflavin-dependent oxidoreductase (nitroreductase family)